MASTVKDLTRGNLWSSIIRFGIPLILTNLLQILFNIADIAVLGRFAGPLPMGAVGCTSMLVFLFTGILMGLGAGVNVLAARSMGEQKEEKIRRAVHTSFLVCLLAGILVLIVGEAFHRPLLRILQTKEELFEDASLYLIIYFLGIPALAVYNFGHAVFSAAGDTRKPLRFLLISGILNVILNLVFVLGFNLDVDGVGAASAISQYVSAFFVLAALFRAEGPHRLFLSAMQIDRKMLAEILSVGIPAALQNAVFAIANLSLQFGVNTLSTAMVAGDAAAKNSDSLIYTVMDAFYVACGSFMGQNFGAGKYDRMMKSYKVSLIYSFGAGGILGILLVLFGPQFLSLFTTDPEVITCGMQRIRVMGPSYAFSAPMDCTTAASRALGKGIVPTVIIILGSCLFRIAWVFTVFRYFKTITSLYLVFIFSWIITAAAECLYFHAISKEVIKGVRHR